MIDRQRIDETPALKAARLKHAKSAMESDPENSNQIRGRFLEAHHNPEDSPYDRGSQRAQTNR